ncbi:MAG TPA: flavodoxin family protein [Oscillospiraceae bacterium]|nr:flavodoxin family protein [Oscillospiraceae bacterium]
MSANIAMDEPLSDKKTVLVLFGSPHKNGHTAYLLNAFLEPFRQKHTEIHVIHAYDEDIAPCTACGYCKKQEGCRYHDFDEIDSLLRRADLLVVATPMYNLSFPSPLKAIIDRTQRYYEARFSLNIKPSIKKHKKAVLLLACGNANPDGTAIMEKQLKMIFSVMSTTLEHTVVWSKTDAMKQGDMEAVEEETRRVALAMQCKL